MTEGEETEQRFRLPPPPSGKRLPPPPGGGGSIDFQNLKLLPRVSRRDSPCSQNTKRRGDRKDRPVVQGEDRDRGDPVKSPSTGGEGAATHSPSPRYVAGICRPRRMTNFSRDGARDPNPPLKGEVAARSADGGVTRSRQGDTPPSLRATSPCRGGSQFRPKAPAPLPRPASPPTQDHEPPAP